MYMKRMPVPLFMLTFLETIFLVLVSSSVRFAGSIHHGIFLGVNIDG